MGKTTGITWTDSTWNPFHGCRKISAGCKNCYMFRDKERYGLPTDIIVRSKANFKQPLKWKEGRRIFVCSWSDFFIEDADVWRKDLWQIMKETPQHNYQILTKRPERIEECLPDDWGDGYDNVILGVTVENQQALKRAEILCQIPAKKRFISFEPLLEPIDFKELIWAYRDDGIDWIIIGGESGNKTGKYGYRECHESWIKSLIFQAQPHGIAIFVKQMGTRIAELNGYKSRHGSNPDEWYKELRIQEIV